MRLGNSTAAANATPKVTPAATPNVRLPKTGGMPSLPIAFVLFLGAGAAVALVRRSRSLV